MLGGRAYSDPESEIFTNSGWPEFWLIYSEYKH